LAVVPVAAPYARCLLPAVVVIRPGGAAARRWRPRCTAFLGLIERTPRQLLRRMSSNFHLLRLAVVWLHSECVCRYALPPEPWGDRQQV